MDRRTPTSSVGTSGTAGSRRRAQLVIVCDAAYPELIEQCRGAIILTSLRRHVAIRPHREFRCVRIECSWQGWFEALPQHGPGRKHERPIVLEPWQREITHEHPRALLRGLIHSDGCRCMNRFRTKLPSGRVAEYEYPRYFFTNVSADIRGIFCEHCDLLGIRWTQSNQRNISISHRRSVAALDGFIGPKS